jgi:serine O-acetyltransferase
VYIAPGAKIYGAIEIADNIAIGANAVVNKSFLEPNITIAGVPARKISDKGSTEAGWDMAYWPLEIDEG